MAYVVAASLRCEDLDHDRAGPQERLGQSLIPGNRDGGRRSWARQRVVQEAPRRVGRRAHRRGGVRATALIERPALGLPNERPRTEYIATPPAVRRRVPGRGDDERDGGAGR